MEKKEIDPEDYDIYEENAINSYPIESVGFFRTILGIFFFKIIYIDIKVKKTNSH